MALLLRSSMLVVGCASASELYGFKVPTTSYVTNFVRIDLNSGAETILSTIPASESMCGTTSKDEKSGIIYNTIRALVDNSFTLNGFQTNGKQVLEVPIPFTNGGADVGRPGSGVLTAYDSATNKVICTGPTSFDKDGFFTVGVYSVDIASKAVSHVTDLPGPMFIEAITNHATVVDGQLLLSYAPKGATDPIFYEVDLKAGRVKQHADPTMYYMDFDYKNSRITGFCKGPSSCTVDPKTFTITQVSQLQIPAGQFAAEMELEYAYDSEKGQACWQLADAGEDKNYLVCHDFATGKVVNSMPLLQDAVSLIFMPGGAPPPGPSPPSPTPPTPPSPPSPTPPAPPGKNHYGDPTQGCLADEYDLELGGSHGGICAPLCDDRPCPTDSPAGTTAKPSCVMPGAKDTYCALVCAEDRDCPSGASCMRAMGDPFICTYGDATNSKIKSVKSVIV